MEIYTKLLCSDDAALAVSNVMRSILTKGLSGSYKYRYREDDGSSVLLSASMIKSGVKLVVTRESVDGRTAGK